MGHQKVAKPSRSDEVLDADQQLKISNQIRAQFDSLAPKRPTKPSRSEPDSTTDNPSAPVSTIHQNIPEFDKLRSLQSQSYVGNLFLFQLCVLRDPAIFQTALFIFAGYVSSRGSLYGDRWICGDTLLQRVDFYWQAAPHGTVFHSIASLFCEIFEWYGPLYWVCDLTDGKWIYQSDEGRSWGKWI